jgi:hypothetical protein
MATNSVMLEQELARTEQALATAKAKTATVTGDALAQIGAVIAGLMAQAEILRARVADAFRSEAEQRAYEAEQTAAKAKAEQLAAFEAHRQQHADRWHTFITSMEAHESAVQVLWTEYDALTGDMRALAKEAVAVGLQVGNLHEHGQELFARMQKRGSVLVHWPLRKIGH